MLHNFYFYVLNHFHLSIQCLQCDNGREFDNHDLPSFLSSKGIVLHLSCPHTSPQNGKAEPSICTINDILRTLMFQAHLKPTYWAEALHTVTYLFNQRPSHPINLLTPYEALYLQPLDYSHLKSFSRLCFPNLSATAPHKLSPRSTACIFIGCPREHVIFNELTFPLASQDSSSTLPHHTPVASDPTESTWDLVHVRSAPALVNLPRSDSTATTSMPQPIIPCPHPTTNSQQLGQSHLPISSSPHVTRAHTTSPAAPSTAPAMSTQSNLSVHQTKHVALASPPLLPSLTSVSATQRPFRHPIQAPQDYMQTRSKSGIFIPKKHVNLSAIVSISLIPASYHSAHKDLNWHNAMREEFHALMNQRT
jgi:hypothetical protein